MEAVDLTILARDPACNDVLRTKHDAWRILDEPDIVATKALNIFVLVLASELPAFTDFIRAANQQHHLRALLVHADIEPLWVVPMLERAHLRTLRNTLVHRGPDVPRRVLNAWRLGAQHDLIADASVIGEVLMVQTCAPERLEIPFDAIDALTRMPVDERAAFTIADDGAYLHWAGQDVHLDIEVLRIAIDPKAREHARQERLRHDERFGSSVATFRKRAGLRQTDIHGLSARQLRRIEGGAFPRVSTLNKLASAHRLCLQDYLGALAEEMATQVE